MGGESGCPTVLGSPTRISFEIEKVTWVKLLSPHFAEEKNGHQKVV